MKRRVYRNLDRAFNLADRSAWTITAAGQKWSGTCSRAALLDSITGYRSQYHEYATLIRATEGTAIGPASQED